MTGFDDFIGDFSREKEKVNATPDIVKETFAMGQDLIDTDYLPKISKIKILKKYLVGFKELNLYKLGWRFNFGSSKEWAGLCSEEASTVGDSKDKNIYVSIQTTKHDNNWKQNSKDVILHEIAHAIIRVIFKNNRAELDRLDDLHKISDGHGMIWKSVCASLCGHECRVFYEKANNKDSYKNYRYTCTFCDHKGYGNYLGFSDTCFECGKSVITEANAS